MLCLCRQHLASPPHLLVVVGAALGQAVQARAPGLAVGVGQGVQALVHLDAGNNALQGQGGHGGKGRRKTQGRR